MSKRTTHYTPMITRTDAKNFDCKGQSRLVVLKSDDVTKVTCKHCLEKLGSKS